MPVVGSIYPPVPAHPPPKRKINQFYVKSSFKKVIEGLPSTEPLRRPPVTSLVFTKRPVLHEVPSVLMNSEIDSTALSGNAGVKISCTVSTFKIALGTCRPALGLKNLVNWCSRKVWVCIEAYHGSASSDGITWGNLSWRYIALSLRKTHELIKQKNED